MKHLVANKCIMSYFQELAISLINQEMDYKFHSVSQVKLFLTVPTRTPSFDSLSSHDISSLILMYVQTVDEV